MYFILTYHFTNNYLEDRKPYRAAHFEYLQPYIASGQLLLGGATATPADRGVLIFHVSDRSVVQSFAADDPYIVHSVVTDYCIHKWTVVAGSLYNS